MSDLFSTLELAAVIEDRDPAPDFVLNRFFPTIIEFDTEEVVFDKVIQERRLLPFVHPMTPAKARESVLGKSDSYRPASVKGLDAIRADVLLKRRLGEPINGNLSPAQRRDLVVQKILMDHDDALNRRLSWMAWRVLCDGSYTITEDGGGVVEMDFGRDAALESQLTADARWGQSAANVYGDFVALINAIAAKGHSAVSDVVFGAGAWAYFSDNETVLKKLDNKSGTFGTVELSGIALPHGCRWVGRVDTVDLWLNTETYRDDAGAEQTYINTYDMIAVSAGGLAGHQCFGAILDAEVLLPMRIYQKNFRTENPGRSFILSESRPLIVPGRVNASGRLQVR